MDDVYQLIKYDLDNVLALSKQYNLSISSWYWRLKETEDEWIERLVKLSKERKEVRGVILGDKKSLEYRIPLGYTTDKVMIHIIQGMQTQEVNTPYASLYETLEKYLQDTN